MEKRFGARGGISGTLRRSDGPDGRPMPDSGTHGAAVTRQPSEGCVRNDPLLCGGLVRRRRGLYEGSTKIRGVKRPDHVPCGLRSGR